MGYSHQVGSKTYLFRDLKDVMAKATPARSGDYLAGVAAGSAEERVAAQMALAELPLAAFARVAHLTVGDFRNWLLSDAADGPALSALAPGLMPEMAAAVSKIMRVQDLVLVARKCNVITRFRNTIGLAGCMS